MHLVYLEKVMLKGHFKSISLANIIIIFFFSKISSCGAQICIMIHLDE